VQPIAKPVFNLPNSDFIAEGLPDGSGNPFAVRLLCAGQKIEA
jgi:hypothetical protein